MRMRAASAASRMRRRTKPGIAKKRRYWACGMVRGRLYDRLFNEICRGIPYQRWTEVISSARLHVEALVGRKMIDRANRDVIDAWQYGEGVPTLTVARDALLA